MSNTFLNETVSHQHYKAVLTTAPRPCHPGTRSCSRISVIMISMFENLYKIMFYVDMFSNIPAILVCLQKTIKTWKQTINKRALLRERKRHTDRGVSSTPSVVLYWGVPLLGGYPTLGTPVDLTGVPPIRPGQGGTPSLLGEVPHLGYPPSDLAGGTPSLLGYPTLGTPSDLAGVTPRQTWLGGTPYLPGVPPQTWLGYPPLSGHGWGTPLAGIPPGWTCGQTDTCQNITFPCTTSSVSKKLQ